jgi:hypothetical protein
MQNVLTSAVFGTPWRAPEVHCPTGNCSWPTTPTVGICSTCKEIKQQVTKYRTNNSHTGLVHTYEVPFAANMSFFANTSAHSGIDTLTLSFDQVQPFHASEGPPQTLAVAASGMAMSADTGNPPYSLLSSEVIIMGVAGADYHTYQGVWTNEGDHWNLSSPETLDSLIMAFSCNFNFCLQGYNATTVNGETQQSLAAVYDNQRSDHFMVIDDAPSDLNAQKGDLYQVTSNAYFALSSAFIDMFFGNVNMVNDFQELKPIVEFDGGAGLQSFWNATNSVDDLSALSRNIADSLTNYMRTTSGLAPHRGYTPSVFADEVFVFVRWQWLVFPLSLVFAGHVFLVLTMWHTKRLRALPWKEGRLPLLLASVDDFIQDVAEGGLVTRTGVHDRVGDIEVYLDYEPGREIALRRAS